MHQAPTPADAFTKFFVESFSDHDIQLAPFGFISLFGVPGASNSQVLFGVDAKSLEIDIQRASGETLAATVRRGQPGSVSDKTNYRTTSEQFTTIARKWPLVETEEPVTADSLLDRMHGENPYSGMGRVERNRVFARQIVQRFIMRHLRTMNFMARESIMEGQQPAIIGTSNSAYIYDFHRDPQLNITPADGWDQAAGTPLQDIDLACERLEQIGYAQPNFMGIGDDAMDALLQNSEFQTLADNRRIELIQVSTQFPVPPEYQRYVDAGWIARGRLKTPKGRTLWLFNYNHTFTDPATGTKVRYLDGERAFITDIRARRDAYHGPPDKLPMTADQRMWMAEMFGFDMSVPPTPVNIQRDDQANLYDPRAFHLDAYRDPNNKSYTMRAQSAPIYAPNQTDAIATLNDLLQA